ncbi:hypothetical protein R3W88_016494 [Solanum pinnatisectum]|uniref:RNase H type-1 domain-containing protein n=1 Tax=Solanum pinnatisectum TaxID=50273 RepID=A0AAV9KXU0_9SOLN|nr:hypothetical protein R3W88_016494 [Solanum pinnatisectum]
MLNGSGKFIVRSAWEILRITEVKKEIFDNIWVKGVPFKVSFFLWRVLKKRLPIGEELIKMRVVDNVRCCCCNEGAHETFQHLFLTCPATMRVWETFIAATGNQIHFLQLVVTIKKWWKVDSPAKLISLYKSIPAFILWHVWRRRNATRHGESMNFSNLIFEINRSLYNLARTRYPWLKYLPKQWPLIVQFLEVYTPLISHKVVAWEKPQRDTFKCSCDGLSKGNPGPSTIGFCIRDWEGNLRYAEARKLTESTSLIAEAGAIKVGMEFCFNNGMTPVVVETNSLIMKKVLDGVSEVPWSISLEIQNIKCLMEKGQISMKHIYREGNQLVDYFTNLVVHFVGTLISNSLQELPGEGKNIILLDKNRTANIRIQKCQNSNYGFQDTTTNIYNNIS